MPPEPPTRSETVLMRCGTNSPRIGRRDWFPVATDLGFQPLQRFQRSLINNGGDPFADAAHRCHNHDMERDVVGLDSARISRSERGEMDYSALGRAIGRHPGRPAIVVASIGTTMTEAVDDGRIRRLLAPWKDNNWLTIPSTDLPRPAGRPGRPSTPARSCSGNRATRCWPVGCWPAATPRFQRWVRVAPTRSVPDRAAGWSRRAGGLLQGGPAAEAVGVGRDGSAR